MSDLETYLGTVAASAWPRPMQSDREDFVSYNWIATLSEPIGGPLDPIQEAIGSASDRGVRQAESEAGMSSGGARPTVRLQKIDDFHILVRVDLPKEDRVNAWLVASSWALRALDEHNPIADLQGLPRRFWLILRSSP